MPRTIMTPADAPNDGARRLREILLTQSLGQVARRLACTRNAVRFWALGTRNPTSEWRVQLETVLGIPPESWSKPCVTKATPARARGG